MTTKKAGKLVWQELTVEHAEQVKDFYSQVIGWDSDAVSMGDYNDFSMKTADGQTCAGICHARGVNQRLPAQWVLYFQVEDLDVSLEAVEAGGGKALTGIQSYGGNARYCVIQDPAGAVCALYEDKDDIE